MTMQIKTLKDFKEDYDYGILKEMGMLDSIVLASYDNEVKKKIKDIRGRMLDCKRTRKDKGQVQEFGYIFYLLNFMKYDMRNFDRLYNYLKTDKVMDIGILSQISKGRYDYRLIKHIGIFAY